MRQLPAAQLNACSIRQRGTVAASWRVRWANAQLSPYHSTGGEGEARAGFLCVSRMISFAREQSRGPNDFHLTTPFLLGSLPEPYVLLVHACWAPRALLGWFPGWSGAKSCRGSPGRAAHWGPASPGSQQLTETLLIVMQGWDPRAQSNVSFGRKCGASFLLLAVGGRVSKRELILNLN